MSAGIRLDVAVLDHIASRLTDAADMMASSAADAPEGMRGSVGTAATSAILQHLLVNAANVCGILEVAAAGVAATRDTCGDTDADVGESWARMESRS